MNIELNESLISEAVNKSATDAITAALCGYKVSNTIGEVVTEQIANGAIMRAINEALVSLDTAALTEMLAREMQNAVTSAVVHIVREGLVDVVCKIRGVDRYGASPLDRDKVRAELFK